MRLLFGIWLLQVLTLGPAWLVLTGDDAMQVVIGIATLLGAGGLGAFWIGSLLRDQRRLTEAQSSERIAEARARFQAALARHKTEDAARLRDLAKRASHGRSRLLKLGLVTGGALGLGGALFFAQFFTAGLVVAAFAGGGLAGFAMRGALARGGEPRERPMVEIAVDGRRRLFRSRPRLTGPAE